MTSPGNADVPAAAATATGTTHTNHADNGSVEPSNEMEHAMPDSSEHDWPRSSVGRRNLLTGRDPKRLFTEGDRTFVRARQGGRCGECGQALPDSFDMHHVIEWSKGGPTSVENALAVCPGCHAKAPVDDLPVFVPRMWQETATGIVHPILDTGGFATVVAAPAAGKTAFAAFLALGLGAAGRIDRIIVCVPSLAVGRQWPKTFNGFGIRLDHSPRYGEERRGYHGMVLTYAALTPATVAGIAASITETTLVILDECHHLASDDDGGDPAAWAAAVTAIVGTYDSPRCPVLNLSGTPFRSLRTQRVTTLRYTPVPDQSAKIQVDPDFEIAAGELIDAGHLRHVDLFTYDAQVELVDLAAGGPPSTANVVDLADQPGPIRSAGLTAVLRAENEFIDPMMDQMLVKMREHDLVLGSPVKGLVVADDAAHADQIGRILERKIPGHVHIVHSKNADPHGDLDAFTQDPGTAVLVSVRMASEGFDCPSVTVLVHATRWSAPLFVAQLSGRAMRVSAAERDAGIVLPATILIPADQQIVAAYRDVLVNVHRILDVKPVCTACNQRPCTCRPGPRDKQCRGCGLPWRVCACDCLQCGGKRRDCGCPRASTSTVGATVITDAQLHAVSHDGSDVAMGLINSIDWSKAGVPQAFVVPAAAAVQATLQANPLDLAAVLRQASTNPTSNGGA